MTKLIFIVFMLGLVCSVAGFGQSPGVQSGPGGGGDSQTSAPGDQNPEAPAPVTDFTSPQSTTSSGVGILSGADVFAPVLGNDGVSFVLPAGQFSIYANSNPGGTSGGSTIGGQSLFTGTLDLRRVTPSTELDLTYAGGEFVDFGPSFDSNGGVQAPDSGTYHAFIAMESLHWRRWQLQIGDEFSYLPESPFDFTGFAGLDTFGVSLGGTSLSLGGSALSSTPILNQTLQPNQTILNGYESRVSNTGLGQVVYNLGRSAITATVADGTLNFLNSGLIDSNSLTIFAGYNYALSRRNYLAITGIYSEFRFAGIGEGASTRGAQLSFGRKLSRRLYLQLGFGPTFGNSALSGPGNATTSSWSTFNSLEYRVARGTFSFSYSRAPTSGSGVLLTVENDWVSASASRQLSRATYGSFNFSYAHNSSIQNGSSGNQQSRFTDWEAGLTLSRSIGERVNAYLYGRVVDQVGSSSVCSVSACPGDVMAYSVGIGMNWHGRPLRLR